MDPGPARAVSVRLLDKADLARRVADVRVPVPRVIVVLRAAARLADLAPTRR